MPGGCIYAGERLRRKIRWIHASSRLAGLRRTRRLGEIQRQPLSFALIWTDPVNIKIPLSLHALFPCSVLVTESDERGGLLRRRITLICAGYHTKAWQCRMTVFRREEAPSNVASPGFMKSLSHKAIALYSIRTSHHSPLSVTRCCGFALCRHFVLEYAPDKSS